MTLSSLRLSEEGVGGRHEKKAKKSKNAKETERAAFLSRGDGGECSSSAHASVSAADQLALGRHTTALFCMPQAVILGLDPCGLG